MVKVKREGVGKGKGRGRLEPGVTEVMGGRMDIINSLPHSLIPSFAFDSQLNLGKILTSIHKAKKKLSHKIEYVVENCMVDLGCAACNSHLVLLLRCEAKGVTVAGWAGGPLMGIPYS